MEEVSKFPPSVAGVSTAIPAFIGYTEKRPKGSNEPRRISSLIEFESLFGGAPTLSYEGGKIRNKDFVLYDSMRLFYDNGGGDCYVSSIGTYEDAADKEKYKNAIDGLKKIDEVTLLLFPDATMLLGAGDLATVQQAALKHCGEMKDRFVLLDVKKDEEGKDAVAEFRNNIGMENLSYGAAYYPYLKSAYAKEFDFDSVVKYLMGTSYWSSIDETLQEELKKMVSSQDEETDVNSLENEEAAKPGKKEEFELRKKALALQIPAYQELLAEMQDEASLIPPSGAIAAVMAATDAKKGVWQAPANVSIASVKAVDKLITDTEQNDMNVDATAGKSVNAIRKFTGKGILVWGARTLDGNSAEWRYISVRRLFNYIEESVQKSTAWAVFQPNDANTWVKIQCQVENFLTNLWRDGALAGATAKQAFYVKVGLGVTMIQQDILDGNLIVEVGIAAVRPAEFIVLKFSHKVQE